MSSEICNEHVAIKVQKQDEWVSVSSRRALFSDFVTYTWQSI